MSETASAAAPGGVRARPRFGRPKNRVLPGFNLTLGYTVFYLCLVVLIPLSALIWNAFGQTAEQFWGAVTVATRHGVVPPDVRRVLSRGACQSGLRAVAGLGTGALPVSRPEIHRRHGRPSVRATDRCRGYLVDGHSGGKWLARPVPRTARHQTRLHPGGGGHRAHIHRAAVRGSYRSTGAGRC